MKTTISEIEKNMLDGLNSRIENVEEKISNLKDILVETIHNKTQRGKNHVKKIAF